MQTKKEYSAPALQAYGSATDLTLELGSQFQDTPIGTPADDSDDCDPTSANPDCWA